MKKLLVLILLFSAAFTSKAQFGRAALFPTIAQDTLTNVDSVSKVIVATAGYNAMGVQVNVKKISGGNVTGKAYIYESLDGVNYIITDSASYVAVPAWSYTTATATHVAIFNKATVPGVYYNILAVSTDTTLSAAVKVQYTLRKSIWR